MLHDEYDAFNPDHAAVDQEELAYLKSCDVRWPDDPIVPVVAAAASSSADPDLYEPPPSYRFTPRSQRGHGDQRTGFTKLGHTAGRAKILFRSALARHTMRQKALIAAAAKAMACSCASVGVQIQTAFTRELALSIATAKPGKYRAPGYCAASRSPPDARPRPSPTLTTPFSTSRFGCTSAYFPAVFLLRARVRAP